MGTGTCSQLDRSLAGIVSWQWGVAPAGSIAATPGRCGRTQVQEGAPDSYLVEVRDHGRDLHFKQTEGILFLTPGFPSPTVKVMLIGAGLC